MMSAVSASIDHRLCKLQALDISCNHYSASSCPAVCYIKSAAANLKPAEADWITGAKSGELERTQESSPHFSYCIVSIDT